MAEKTVPAKQEEQELTATREDSRYLVPPVDIYETDDGLTVVADLPGAKKDDVDINVEDNVLTIKAKAESEMKGNALLEEFGLLNYFRQFELSEHVDQEKINASFKNGVLTLSLPKAEKAKPKKIAVAMS